MMSENIYQLLQFELKPEIAGGIYSNLAVVTHSAAEIVTDFVQMLPGMQKAQVASRIIMTPENAKRLLFALQDNIIKYEQQFGEITFGQPANDDKTVAPFNIKKGDA